MSVDLICLTVELQCKTMVCIKCLIAVAAVGCRGGCLCVCMYECNNSEMGAVHVLIDYCKWCRYQVYDLKTLAIVHLY